MTDGFLILSAAIDASAIDRYLGDLQLADAEKLILVDHQSGITAYDAARLRIPLNRLTDTHWAVPAGQNLIGTTSLIAALQSALNSSQLLCFETFHLEVGLAMRLHRESWYVGLRDRPQDMLTAWIALEDMQPGAGEPIYVPGSHRFSGYDQPEIGTPTRHEQVVTRFGIECERAGLRRFLARKGDVLITRADLAVGGAPITNPDATCRMLIAHFCPLQDDPGYFVHFAPEYRVKRQLTPKLYSSTVYVGKF